MRTSDADILVIPGLGGSGPDHWQSRWEAKIPAVRRVVQGDWEHPGLDAWRERIIEDVARAARPVVLVAHSLGVLAAAHAAPLLAKGATSGKVKGGFFVAPPSRNVLTLFRASRCLSLPSSSQAGMILIHPLPTARNWRARLARS